MPFSHSVNSGSGLIENTVQSVIERLRRLKERVSRGSESCLRGGDRPRPDEPWLLRGAADLDESLTCPKEFDRRRPCFGKDALQVSIRSIPASDPENLWRRAMHPNEIDEVPVLRHYDRPGLPGFEEDS